MAEQRLNMNASEDLLRLSGIGETSRSSSRPFDFGVDCRVHLFYPEQVLYSSTVS